MSAVFVGTAVGLFFTSVPIGLVAAAIAFAGGLRTYGREERPLGSVARVVLTVIIMLGVTLVLWILWVIASAGR